MVAPHAIEHTPLLASAVISCGALTCSRPAVSTPSCPYLPNQTMRYSSTPQYSPATADCAPSAQPPVRSRRALRQRMPCPLSIVAGTAADLPT